MFVIIEAFCNECNACVKEVHIVNSHRIYFGYDVIVWRWRVRGERLS